MSSGRSAFGVAGCALLWSLSGHAAVPVIDTSALSTQIMQFVQDEALHQREMVIERLNRQFLGELHDNAAQREADGFAQVVQHDAMVEKSIHQAGVKERSRGDRTSCHNQAVAVEVGRADDYAEVVLAGRQGFARAEFVTSGFGRSPEEQRVGRTDRLKRMEHECRDGGGCLAAGLLMGADESLGASQMAATERMTELVLGPNQPLSPVWRDPDVMTDAEVAYVVGDYRRMALLSLAHASMSAVAGYFAAPVENGRTVGLSRMGALTEFVDARLAPESKWIKAVSNAHADAGRDPVMPAEVARQSLVVDAFRAKVALYALEGDLRREMLQAALLAVEVTPP